jgi:hypothetical protein
MTSATEKFILHTFRRKRTLAPLNIDEDAADASKASYWTYQRCTAFVFHRIMVTMPIHLKKKLASLYTAKCGIICNMIGNI